MRMRKLFGVAAILMGLAAPVCAVRAEEAAPPPINGHFTLTTLDGRDVSNTDYRGKWMLIYFGYTFCPDVCPTTLSQIGSALDALGAKAKDFQPIFITLDPARDKTPVMKDYMKSFDPRIVALRGEPDDIEDAAKSFHVYYRPRSLGNGQYTVDHSSYIYVIDPKGKFVELLTGDLPGHPLVDDLRKLDK
ncbi:MAG TPA: SCO family protein [Rhizomicrobium sp.]|nr:SCO family protein [Rhizomicrobium sp.]